MMMTWRRSEGKHGADRRVRRAQIGGFALSWFIDIWFVYFKYDFPSCAVLLICWFFLILCSHHFLYEGAMCSLEK